MLSDATSELLRGLGAAAAEVRAASLEPEQTRRRRAEVTEEKMRCILLALDVALGPSMLDKAVELCQERQMNAQNRRRSPIRGFVAQESRRRCYHVRGDQKKTYLCMEGFCSCRSFVAKVMTDSPFCKHLVALEISLSLGYVEQVEVAESEFSTYLNEI